MKRNKQEYSESQCIYILYLTVLLANMAGSESGIWEVKHEFRKTKI
jgi:hypothetical protein